MLDAKTSLAVAAGASGLVFATFAAHLPSIADGRSAAPHDTILSGSIKAAAWTSTAAVVGVSLITKDATVFVVGAATIVVLTWLHRHANAYDAARGMASMPTPAQVNMAAMAG